MSLDLSSRQNSRGGGQGEENDINTTKKEKRKMQLLNLILRWTNYSAAINYLSFMGGGYLIWATFGARTVFLINDYRVIDILHDNVTKSDVFHISIARPGPWFYTHSILSSWEKRARYCHILYTTFVCICTQTTNAASTRQKWSIREIIPSFWPFFLIFFFNIFKGSHNYFTG